MVFQPLGRARRARKRARAPDRVCMTAGCGAKIASWKWLCDACFGQLPFDRKREICTAREAREPHRVFGLSRDAAEWLADQRIKFVGE
jgi:predicted amidophosphoribosyltransferase